jgi:hypothetical protein
MIPFINMWQKFVQLSSKAGQLQLTRYIQINLKLFNISIKTLMKNLTFTTSIQHKLKKIFWPFYNLITQLTFWFCTTLPTNIKNSKLSAFFSPQFFYFFSLNLMAQFTNSPLISQLASFFYMRTCKRHNYILPPIFPKQYYNLKKSLILKNQPPSHNHLLN